MPITATSIQRLDASSSVLRPLFLSHVSAGDPSPVDDEINSVIDLNEQLIRNPEATYYVKVEGESMVECGIHDGDVLIVDRSFEPSDGSVVIASLDGELTVKRIKRANGRLSLVPENPLHDAIPVSEANELVIWGVVRHVIHSLP